MEPPKQQYQNRVLAALPKTEISRLTPHLSPVALKLRTLGVQAESSALGS